LQLNLVVDKISGSIYNAGVQGTAMSDEFLTKCVIDTLRRTVYIYSSEGDKKTIECDTVDEFMNVLQFVRATADEDIISYAEPA
jgi:hypothetical protein